MNTQYLLTSKKIDIFRQEARKLKREKGINHVQALDEIAQQYHFNHWHHVSDSYKVLEATENAVQSGLMIAMDGKEADNFYDEKGQFIQDDNAFFFCKSMLYRDYIEELDEDGVRWIDKTSEEELKEDFESDFLSYGFFRFTNKTLPKTINEILKLIEKFCFWQPEYIWFKGNFYNKYTYLEKLTNLENGVNTINHENNIKEYLLKIVDGAKVTYKKYDENSTPEVLKPRQDLNPHPGGFSWGYSGAGVVNLAYAILGDCLRNDELIHKNVNKFVTGFLSYLDGKKNIHLQKKK